MDRRSGPIDERGGGVDDHRLERLARFGFVAKGFVYAIVGLLAGRMAFGGSSQQASQEGAFDALSKQPFGIVLLLATAVGLLAYGGYRLLLVYTGPDHDTELPTWLARLSDLGRGLIYLGLAALAGREVVGGAGSGGGGGGQGTQVTRAVLDVPGGPWIVGVVGVSILAIGLIQLVRAVRTDWQDELSSMGMQDGEGTLTHRLGQVGYTGRGIVYGLVGWFVLQSAVTYDPQKGGGLDVALREVQQTSFGTVALLLIAAALVAYGVFAIQQGRHRRF